MLSINIMGKNNETLHEASCIRVFSDDGCSARSQITHLNMDTATGQVEAHFRHTGPATVFVMNESGKTIARYELVEPRT